MSARTAAARFVRAPMSRRLLALEALAELCRARLLTLLPARFYTRAFGTPGREGDAPASAIPERESAALSVGSTVAAVANHLPIRALCLQQAIAVSRMLARRGVPSRLVLGVSRDPADAPAAASGLAAHAWVEVGGRVVSGGGELERYAVLARFG